MISFVKYQGAGNDFVLIDDRTLKFPQTAVSKLCDRRFGIGADGLILLQKSEKAAFRMRIFNADGGEAAMCGNGIRCLFHFAGTLGFTDESYWIETMESRVRCQRHGDKVGVFFEKPKLIVHDLLVSLEKSPIDVWNTGVPHAVLFVDKLEEVKLPERGRKIRYDTLFAPHGVNVNFANISKEDGRISVRTYERGVEGETLACGTGAVAVALSAQKRYAMKAPILIYPASGDLLEVSIPEAEGPLELIGPAVPVFSGNIVI